MGVFNILGISKKEAQCEAIPLHGEINNEGGGQKSVEVTEDIKLGIFCVFSYGSGSNLTHINNFKVSSGTITELNKLRDSFGDETNGLTSYVYKVENVPKGGYIYYTKKAWNPCHVHLIKVQ